MKCSNCGLPLSPTRTSCPRCGTPYASSKSSLSTKAASEPWAQNQGFAGQEPGFPLRGPQTGTESNSPWDMQGQGGADASIVPPAMQPTYADMPMRQEPYGAPWQQGAAPTPFSPYARIPQRPEQKPLQRPAKLGLSLAALCVVAAALILVFVYFMAQGLPAPKTDTNALPTATSVTQLITPTATSPITPSPSNPGQQYIDGAQTASAVAPLQPATSFTTNQKIYINFSVHKSGFACLYWHINGAQFFNFPLPISTYTKTASSYATTSSTGSGFVEIYWASTDTCTDQVLAQHVAFTIA